MNPTEGIQTTLTRKLIHPFIAGSKFNKILLLALTFSLIFGIGTGYYLAGKKAPVNIGVLTETPKSPQADIQTFRDSAEGVLKPKPTPGDNITYTEGTHILVREGFANVTLTSSVVDLNQYEGKKVKVLGETQKALKEGWLMDVGRVDV